MYVVDQLFSGEVCKGGITDDPDLAEALGLDVVSSDIIADRLAVETEEQARRCEALAEELQALGDLTLRKAS